MGELHDRTARDAESRRGPEWPPPDWYVVEKAEDQDGVLSGLDDTSSKEECEGARTAASGPAVLK